MSWRRRAPRAREARGAETGHQTEVPPFAQLAGAVRWSALPARDGGPRAPAVRAAGGVPRLPSPSGGDRDGRRLLPLRRPGARGLGRRAGAPRLLEVRCLLYGIAGGGTRPGSGSVVRADRAVVAAPADRGTRPPPLAQWRARSLASLGLHARLAEAEVLARPISPCISRGRSRSSRSRRSCRARRRSSRSRRSQRARRASAASSVSLSLSLSLSPSLSLTLVLSLTLTLTLTQARSSCARSASD